MAGAAFRSITGFAVSAAFGVAADTSGFLASDVFENDLKDMGIPFMERQRFAETIDVMRHLKILNGRLFNIYL